MIDINRRPYDLTGFDLPYSGRDWGSEVLDHLSTQLLVG